MFGSAAAAIWACFAAFFLRMRKMARIIMAVMTRRPPTAPPTIAPIGTDDLCEGDGEGDTVVFVELVPARVYVGV